MVKLEESFDEKLKRTADRLGLEPARMPHHIAIIMDGNGRWATEKGKRRGEGHRRGGKTVEEIAQNCVDLGIESLTLYSFSNENWKRPKYEIAGLMDLYAYYLSGIRAMLKRNRVKLIHLGRGDRLPKKVKKELAKTMELTSANTGMTLALALDYGGRTEIADAAKKIAQEYKDGQLGLDDIDEQCISDHLYAPGFAEPDLLIRTANEMRISNFLLWQISYSEFYVTKTLWPDFKQEDLEEAMIAYAQRGRRFGNIETD